MLLLLLLELSVRHLERQIYPAPEVQGAWTQPQPHLYSGQIIETEASSEERVSERLQPGTPCLRVLPHRL